MVHREPGTDGGELTFERPDWLWPAPMSSYDGYSQQFEWRDVQDIWWRSQLARTDNHGSLYDTHSAALEGDPGALETMYRFYIALVTHRLTS